METASPGMDEPAAGPVLRPYSPCPRHSAPHPGGEVLPPAPRRGGGEGPDDPITPVHGGRDLDTRAAVERQRHHDPLLSEPLDLTRFRPTGIVSPGRQQPQARSGTGPEASWDRAADRLSVKPVKIGAKPIRRGGKSGNEPDRGVQMPMHDAATCMNGRPPTAGAVVRPVPPLLNRVRKSVPDSEDRRNRVGLRCVAARFPDRFPDFPDRLDHSCLRTPTLPSLLTPGGHSWAAQGNGWSSRLRAATAG